MSMAGASGEEPVAIGRAPSCDAASVNGEAGAVIEALMALHPRGHDLSLDRIARLLRHLGDPHLRLPPVIHVAGTNGKGSVSAFARAILEADGKAVHVHTSPHLVRWHERYRLGAPGGGRLVEDGVLAEAVRRVARANDGAAITVFEILTAAAFLLFAEYPADAAVLEVGLGGRFDATNVVRDPAVAVVTSIALDHQQWLGDTREAIAAEKAGILKRGRPAVIGYQRHEGARETLVSEAERRGALPIVYNQDFSAHEEHGRMVYQDGDCLLDLPLPALAGRHQIGNAAAAIAALKAGGLAPTERAIAEGMVNVAWPGRMQRLPDGPLRALARPGTEIWLDGGHNPAAARVVAEALAQMEERNPAPLLVVAGMLTTKEPGPFFEAFRGLAHQVLTVPVASSEAGYEPSTLAGHAVGAGLNARPVAGLEDALAHIAKGWREERPRVLIGGSLYVVGEALRLNGTFPD